jgi:hypothetical protein
MDNASMPDKRRARLVELLAEHRTDGSDVQHARGGDDQEHREDMRQTPDDLVVHAGQDMAVCSSVKNAYSAARTTSRPGPAGPELALACILLIDAVFVRHGLDPLITNAGVQPQVGAHFGDA